MSRLPRVSPMKSTAHKIPGIFPILFIRHTSNVHYITRQWMLGDLGELQVKSCS